MDQDQTRKLSNDYRAVFGTKEGNRVLWDIINHTYFLHPYEQENAGAYKKEGKRELGLYILGQMGLTEDLDSLTRLVQSLQTKIKGEDHDRRR